MKTFFFSLLICLSSCKNNKENNGKILFPNFVGILKTKSNFKVKDSTFMSESQLKTNKKTLHTTLFFSDGFLKEEVSGENEFIIYDSKLKSIFFKKENTDTIYVQKHLSSNNKEDIKYELFPNKTTILGYKCDLVMFKDENLNINYEVYYTKEIRTSVYYNDSFYNGIINIFKNFVVLKYVMKTPSIDAFFTVTDIIPKKIEKVEFEINKESILKYIE